MNENKLVFNLNLINFFYHKWCIPKYTNKALPGEPENGVNDVDGDNGPP